MPHQSPEPRRSVLSEAFAFLELVYFSIVREVRKQSGNAALGIVSAMARIIGMVAVFYFLMEIAGMRGAMIRGNTLLYLVSGIMLFFLHVGAVGKVVSAGASVNPMMQHAPVTTALMIVTGAVTELYLNLLASAIIIVGLWIFTGGVEIENPVMLIIPVLLAWATGVVVGLLLLLLKPYTPLVMRFVSLAYQRAQLITSGKFFIANLLPASLLQYFSWNPLFHCIDQARGYMFINYSPMKTSLDYPINFVIIGLIVGMMIEFWLRKTVSRSQAATR